MATEPGHTPLNEHQRNHIRASCQYIDRILGDLDAAVAAAASGSPFARYVDDLTPTQKRLVRDYATGIRAQMLRVLKSFGIEPGGPVASARHAVRTSLGFVEIALEEIKPQYMRGYGEMPAAAVPELNGLVVELQALVQRLEASLARGSAADLGARLTKLADGEGPDGLIHALQPVEQAISHHGLVEFRPALEAILERCDPLRFEVAVFGRVSTGKSTLLNYVVGRSVLPVGVTPVTAVPTRLEPGREDRLLVQFADRPGLEAPLTALAEYVTEEGNPENRWHVTRLTATLANSTLPTGVALVDTPGLGSLATDGAAETLAYLPRCDLGIVLVDATAPLAADDVGTVARLGEADIPALVLLSKADLLSASDLARVLAYAERHLTRELGVAIAVHAVSTATGHTHLADRWVATELRPRLADHQVQVLASLRRKAAGLRAGVRSVLEARLGRPPAARPTAAAADRDRIETDLRNAAGLFEDVRRLCESLRNPPQRELTEALDLAADRATTALDYPESVPGGPEAAARTAIAHVAADFADDIRRPLGVLVDRLRTALTEARQAAGLPAGGADEWSTVLRELPPFAFGDVPLAIRVPLRKALGRRVAMGRVRTAIATQMGKRVEQALRAHGLALHEWSLRALGRLRADFSAQAEIIRSQICDGRAAGADEATALRADLAALGDTSG